MLQLPPPADEEEFDAKVEGALRARHANPHLIRYGRRGQAQHGVDGIDPIAAPGEGIVWQSTVQASRLMPKLRADLLLMDTSGLEPRLFILAVGVERDARLQDQVAALSRERQSKGRCPLEILFWNEIRDIILSNDQLGGKWYPQLFPLIALGPHVAALLQELLEKLPPPVKPNSETRSVPESEVDTSARPHATATLALSERELARALNEANRAHVAVAVQGVLDSLQASLKCEAGPPTVAEPAADTEVRSHIARTLAGIERERARLSQRVEFAPPIRNPGALPHADPRTEARPTAPEVPPTLRTPTPTAHPLSAVEWLARHSQQRSLFGKALAILVVGASMLLVALMGWLFLGRPDADGGDARRPALAPDDQGFIDKHGGWDWGNRCWKHINSQKWGWAKAACDRAMAMNPASPAPRTQVLYNLGLIEQSMGNVSAARQYFAQSLELREHPDVRRALDSLR
ncbi:MAG: tetratricopeptide repeat protein [Polyangiaceae bacterium]